MDLIGADIVRRIDSRLALRGEKRQNLADSLNFSVANIAKWKHYGSLPSLDIAFAIAGYLGVSVRWLITGEDEQGLTLEDRNLLVKYNSLTGENQRNVLALIDSMLSVPVKGEKEVLA